VGLVGAAPAVDLQHVTITRGNRQVVRNATFSLDPGSITGLIGPSGCGKSTVIRAIVGTQRRVAGDVHVLGLPAGSAALRRRVAYTTQGRSIYTDLTVRDNLRYFAQILGVPSSRVDRALARLTLAGHADDLVQDLSGGQQQRVSLAVALLGDTELLVLDEPTVGLDPVLRNELWSLFHELAAAGSTLLVSSHVMDEAERCDRLIFMRDGVILAAGTPHELRERTGAGTLEQAFLRLTGEKAPAA
jgi:ABC-2 type transport system ATP-binding protein